MANGLVEASRGHPKHPVLVLPTQGHHQDKLVLFLLPVEHIFLRALPLISCPAFVRNVSPVHYTSRALAVAVHFTAVLRTTALRTTATRRGQFAVFGYGIWTRRSDRVPHQHLPDIIELLHDVHAIPKSHKPHLGCAVFECLLRL